MNGFSPRHFPFPPLANVPVDLRVEEDEQNEGDDSESDETSPVKVDRVVRVHSELSDVQYDLVLGHIAPVDATVCRICHDCPCSAAAVDNIGRVIRVKKERQISFCDVASA